MEKLVRDRIPEIIKADRGEMPPFRIAPQAEYRELLTEKLSEETEEYLESREPEELADILEVVLALAREVGLSPQALEELRREKAQVRGGFDNRIVMDFP